MNDLTMAQRMACWQFRSQRATYYDDLAMLIDSSHMRLLDIFRKDGARFGKAPRGELSRLWEERFIVHGADLASAWSGTLPDLEVAVLRVQSNTGDKAISNTLRELSRMARLSERIVQQVIATLLVGFITVALASGMLLIMVPWTVSVIREALDIPYQYWGPVGRFLAAVAQWAEFWRGYIVLGLLLVLMGLSRLQQWTGQWRAWCDEHLIGINTLRDLMAIRLLLMLGTLTTSHGGNPQTLEDALQQMMRSAPNPWVWWRLDQILYRVVVTGATDSSVFNTGFLPQEIYWRMRDVEEGQGLAKAFNATGTYIQELMLPRLMVRLTVLRWMMIVPSLVLGLVVMGTIQVTNFEMKSASLSYINSQNQ
ncbi:MAG: hypothetical protein QM527_07985 [Alphaproteobacteria bacterium]|nr:hypothetical protein [Alphaproteobacteria bacterium]